MSYNSLRRFFMYQRTKRDPRTKEEVLDRMLSYDFDGDVRNVGAEQARLTRTAANKLLLTFPATGITYELEVHRPRAENVKQPETRSFAPKSGEQYIAPEKPDATDDQPAPARSRGRITRAVA
jgi:hypothetical protein